MLWKQEVREMLTELHKSSVSAANKKDLLNHLTFLDEDLMNQTMAVYLERCKFKYTMAFFQWRSIQGKSSEEDL